MAFEYTYVLDVRSFRGAECDIDRYLVVSKAREILAEINKQHRTGCGEI